MKKEKLSECPRKSRDVLNFEKGKRYLVCKPEVVDLKNHVVYELYIVEVSPNNQYIKLKHSVGSYWVSVDDWYILDVLVD